MLAILDLGRRQQIVGEAAQQPQRDVYLDVRRDVQPGKPISQSIDEKRLPDDTDAVGLAATTMAVIQGMSTLARDGATREKLLNIPNITMKIWP